MFKRMVRKIVGIRYECRECGEIFEKPGKEIFAINCQTVDVCPKCKSPRIKNC